MEQYLSWKGQLDQRFEKTHSLETFIDASLELTRYIGFDFFAYTICKTTLFTRPNTHVVGNYPSCFLLCYTAQNYALVDPTVRHCKLSNEPLRWSESLFSECPKLWRAANKHHLNMGVSQPSFNCSGSLGLLSLSRRETVIDDHEFDSLKPLLKAFSEVATQKVFEFDNSLAFQPDIEFGEKEKEVLRWIADGKTSEEIGRIMNITADTVNFHLRNIQKKTGTCNRVQAVSYAVAQGCI